MLTGQALLLALLKLALVLAATALFTALILAFLTAMVLLRPPRMSSGKALVFLKRLSPADLNLPYEDIHFTFPDIRTGKTIRAPAWFLPHPTPSDRLALILHGFGDAKIGAIAWAPLLQSLGYNILAVDLRAHGENLAGFSTAGFDERFDICHILDQVKSQRPDQSRQIILFGVSLGAAVAAAVATVRNDLAAVILECPYLDFPSAVLLHVHTFGIPGRLIPRLALWMCQSIARIDYSQVRPIDLIPQIRCPLLLIQTGDDPFVTDADHAAIESALHERPSDSPPAQVWNLPNSFHVLGLADHPAEYRQKLQQFLSHTCQPAQT